MIGTGQYLSQRQVLQQRLSPQQIQFIKLLQLPTQALEQRIKEELETNPILEEADLWEEASRADQDEPADSETTDPTDRSIDIDWESVMNNDEPEGYAPKQRNDDFDWRDIPRPYHETLIEDLEKQVGLLDLSVAEQALAEQIIGSLDEDGYLRRDLQAIADAVAFHEGIVIRLEEAESLLHRIQRLEPPGMACRNLRECLLVQLEQLPHAREGRGLALRIVRDEWDHFERKHFEKLQRRLDADETELREAYSVILSLNPKPGGASGDEDEPVTYVIPDFEVTVMADGEFLIQLNSRNLPPLRISPKYKKMWDEHKGDQETRQFIRTRIESAKWFIDSIQQRQNTLLTVMTTIVALQERFFRQGENLRPMILKDVADRVGMDISTISRVVNGKYVQTPFGVFELKYFFNEGLETESGEDVSNRELKNLVAELIGKEDKSKPLSDDAIAAMLADRGFKVARRTVTKYREQLGIAVARLRKEM